MHPGSSSKGFHRRDESEGQYQYKHISQLTGYGHQQAWSLHPKKQQHMKPRSLTARNEILGLKKDRDID